MYNNIMWGWPAQHDIEPIAPVVEDPCVICPRCVGDAYSVHVEAVASTNARVVQLLHCVRKDPPEKTSVPPSTTDGAPLRHAPIGECVTSQGQGKTDMPTTQQRQTERHAWLAHQTCCYGWNCAPALQTQRTTPCRRQGERPSGVHNSRQKTHSQRTEACVPAAGRMRQKCFVGRHSLALASGGAHGREYGKAGRPTSGGAWRGEGREKEKRERKEMGGCSKRMPAVWMGAGRQRGQQCDEQFPQVALWSTRNVRTIRRPTLALCMPPINGEGAHDGGGAKFRVRVKCR